MNTIKSELEEISQLFNTVSFENHELTKEINSLLQSVDDVMVFIYSRRCLEVIITEICETTLNRDRGTEPMKGIIDKISKEKLIPPFISTAMQNVNNNSTYGAHPKDFDKRQVRSTLIDLTTVLDWYFFDLKKLEKRKVDIAFKEETGKTKKNAAAEPLEKSQKIENPSKKAGMKSIYYLGVLIIVAAGIAIYFIIGNKTVKNEGTVSQTMDTLTNITEKIKIDSKSPINNKKPEETAKPANTEPSIIDNKEKPVTNVPKALDLPEDLESALNIMKDVSKDYKKRKASIPVLLNKFVANAEVVLLNNDGIFLESWSINEYLDKISGIGIRNVKQIKITGQEYEGSKIKLLKVQHTK